MSLLKMHIFQTQFLYALVKEKYIVSKGDISKEKTDTTLRIVYWWDDEGGYFVIYGNRPESKVSGPFSPYRVRCNTVEQVCRFVKTIIATDSDVAIELHQFDALNDDSEDPLNVDWENNAENGSTELVAFDFIPKTGKNGELYVPFKNCLTKVLRQLIDVESV